MRVTILSVAAAVVLLGGSAAGLQFMNRSTEKAAASCAQGETCAIVTPTASGPPAAIDEPADPLEEESPPEDTPSEEAASEDDPTEEAGTGETPTTGPTTNVNRPTTDRGPAAKKTNTPKPDPEPEIDSQETPPPDVEIEEEEDQQQLGAPTPTATTGTPQAVVTTQPPTVPQPQQPGGEDVAAGGAAVRVGFDVVNRALVSYTAELKVVNDTTDDLARMRLSLPVGGVVSSVPGVEWDQRGDTLVLDYDAEVPAGEEVVITFTAVGEAEAPDDCKVTGATCAVE
ncbi:hypothetical protein [Thermocatellispora tengchongensis]